MTKIDMVLTSKLNKNNFFFYSLPETNSEDQEDSRNKKTVKNSKNGRLKGYTYLKSEVAIYEDKGGSKQS